MCYIIIPEPKLLNFIKTYSSPFPSHFVYSGIYQSNFFPPKLVKYIFFGYFVIIFSRDVLKGYQDKKQTEAGTEVIQKKGNGCGHGYRQREPFFCGDKVALIDTTVYKMRWEGG